LMWLCASGVTESPRRWSDCSREQLADSFHQSLDYCLRDRPNLLLRQDIASCGNALTEPGEDCDCGLPAVSSSVFPASNRLVRSSLTCHNFPCLSVHISRVIRWVIRHTRLYPGPKGQRSSTLTDNFVCHFEEEWGRGSR